MYSPHLYGRRSEMLALRAVLGDGESTDSLLPIIEPVLANTGDLGRCMDVCNESGVPLVVRVNPEQHEFANPAVQRTFRTEVADLLKGKDSLLPGFCVNAHASAADVDAFFRQYSDRRVALLYSSPALSSPAFASLMRNPDVAYHIVLDERVSDAQLRAIPREKLIDIRDDFNKLLRNADYDGAEFFSDRYRRVPEDFVGVGDYTIIGRALEIGGGRPGAVVIHATYKRSDAEDIWVEHFVSDDTDRDESDVASKYLQAARKLVRQSRARPDEFGNDAALQAYASDVRTSHYPGLGKNKEYQIRHHIRLMLSAISGEL